ncbi:cytochrome P450 monooxygenase-like protein [Saccharata proteae CBS 121410]|uniref:Cytochrome P450 monooxygenase-like protein n=1 Tax=Saccharata proteae CBS 121410 TaxID=1314787 RepID=A0A9P4HYK6_9PEZI|nr:cytochrome P450 monooxygenase-like protein [Saccharata proteae CBS 121410]
MTSALFWTFLVLPLCYSISACYTLYRNHAIARKTGIPTIVVPISPENPIWLLLSRFVVPLVKKITGPNHFTRFGYIGWEFPEKNRIHLELGDAFLLVTPGHNWLYLCDAEAIADVFHRERRGDFMRPVELLAMLDVFGPNISTVQGADWQRQRKCTAATFNESVNQKVWTTSLRQAEQMLEYWIIVSPDGVNSTADDSRTLALDVLLSAGFGKDFPFRSSTAGTENPTGPLSYRDSLALILQNAILILALGPKLLSRLSYPKSWARIGQATVTFKQYMADMVSEEKALIAQGESGSGNLMTSMVKASVESGGGDSQGQRQSGLSEEEIFGNMFVFNFAGHDTTAHTFAFTFLELGVHPEVQDWMSEEILYVLGEDESKWSYDAFPRLKRCLAVLLETLRLFDPILSVMKGTTTTPMPLTISNRTHIIPPHTRMNINLNALHTHPRYWGDHGPLAWRPSRWILSDPSAPGPAAIDREYLLQPPKGAYVPWSDGVRGCPGKKFAQVEHVAVMAKLFKEHVVRPKRREGESEEEARRAVQGVIDDSGMVLLLQLLRPERASLVWGKRKR